MHRLTLIRRVKYYILIFKLLTHPNKVEISVQIDSIAKVQRSAVVHKVGWVSIFPPHAVLDKSKCSINIAVSTHVTDISMTSCAVVSYAAARLLRVAA